MSENEQESMLARVQRSRRNFLVMGGIATSALLAMVTTARSEDEHENENEHEGGHKCFLKGTTIDTAGGQAQSRKSYNWRFVADGVRGDAPRPMDRALSIQEERSAKALGERRTACSHSAFGPRAECS